VENFKIHNPGARLLSSLSNIRLANSKHSSLLPKLQKYLKVCFSTRPGANVIKLFTVVINLHSTCVIKLYYLGKYPGMAINYNAKKFYNIGPWWQT
jgi:hypothetical protein